MSARLNTHSEGATLVHSTRDKEVVRAEVRAALLQRVTAHGYIDDYSGVRIAANGQRFRIRQAVVWNIVDENGVYCGQAASFDQWDDLPANDA